jgi:hypothetical protein
LEDRIEKLRPDVFLKSYESFEEPKLRQRYIQSTLKAMRENRLDVRRFYFSQLSQLIQQVAIHQKADLHVFYNYFLSCLEQDYYSKAVLKEHFSSFSALFHLFVREGFLAHDSLSRIYFTYVLTLKDKFEKEGASCVGFNELVHIVWALVVTEDETLANPLIPRLWEHLHEFQREHPLTREELLELHQVQAYVQDQVRAGRWPKELKEVLPKRVREMADEEYGQFDKNLYPEVQMDVARKLLKLRATFQENTRVARAFRVDFKLEDVSKVILIKGKDQLNTKTSEWLGLHGMKHKYLSRRLRGLELVVIDADKWSNMQESEQYEYLYDLSRSPSTATHDEDFEVAL